MVIGRRHCKVARLFFSLAFRTRISTFRDFSISAFRLGSRLANVVVQENCGGYEGSNRFNDPKHSRISSDVGQRSSGDLWCLDQAAERASETESGTVPRR